MIQKPKNYDTIQVGGGESLKAGGHKCVIKQIEEGTSSKGNQMLVIYYDTADEDIQPHFYMDRYLNDTRADKKWGGRFFITVTGDYGPANLKRFCTAVEDSNDGFQAWDFSGNLRMDAFKNMKVGLIFRREEYTAPDHQLRVATKGFRWCKYENAYDQKEPELKKLPQSEEAIRATTPAGVDYGFVDVPADALEDEGLPFK